MNENKEWQNLLKTANEELEASGYSILIVEPEKGFFNCEIYKDNNLVETYAENYYEDELDDLITDAVDYIRTDLMGESKGEYHRYEMSWSQADSAWMVVYARDLNEAEAKFENGEYVLEK